MKEVIRKTSLSSPKLADVAQHAGVSPATVSRVLNNTAPVHGDTRERVQAAIAALGYQHPLNNTPESQATTGTIALLITDMLNPFFLEVMRGVEDEAESSGLMLLLCNTSEDPLREKKVLQALSERHVDGIIALAGQTRIPAEDLIALHERNNTPLVIINRRIDRPDIPCIVVDLENAAYRSAQHLLALKHTRLAYLSGLDTSESSQARRRGIKAALKEVGLTLAPEMCPASFPSIEGGFQAMSALLSLPEEKRPTAVIVYNDIMAFGALHAIRTYGMHVPNDISVVGCDGLLMSAHSNPPLTTIDQPKYNMGRLAMQTIRQIRDHQYTPIGGYTLMESPLIIRESSGPCLRGSKE
jgi:DNA-binding LacI/PurR family transcriptional regulator